MLARVILSKSSNPIAQTVQQFARTQLTFLESICGAPASFTPTFTHVLLVAILLAMLTRR